MSIIQRLKIESPVKVFDSDLDERSFSTRQRRRRRRSPAFDRRIDRRIVDVETLQGSQPITETQDAQPARDR